MKRRDFFKRLAQGTAGAATAGVLGAPVLAQDDLPELDWQMPTSWPLSLDTLYGGAQLFAERVGALTGGRFRITARAADELVPGTQVLDAVSEGAVQIGHTASYYYVGKSPVLAFGTTVPFGLTAQQQNAWLFEGGGLAALQEFYARNFNVIQFPAGNTGTQMGGWFRREINTVEDLRGLRMRIPGLGGEVLSRLGVTVQVLAGGEIFQALQTGTVDAAEWVGPYDDEKLGLNQVAQFYYYPGWWEPSAAFEVEVNLDEWNALPPEYQEAIRTAAFEANTVILTRYEARNNEALRSLIGKGVQVRRYSDEIMAAAEEATFALYEEFSAQNPDFAAIYTPWREFRDRVYAWNSLNQHSLETFLYRNLDAEAEG
jgi:TRAP-type mannitol/chloroaromatic compound transport system substrate-binding protein